MTGMNLPQAMLVKALKILYEKKQLYAMYNQETLCRMGGRPRQWGECHRDEGLLRVSEDREVDEVGRSFTLTDINIS